RFKSDECVFLPSSTKIISGRQFTPSGLLLFDSPARVTQEEVTPKLFSLHLSPAVPDFIFAAERKRSHQECLYSVATNGAVDGAIVFVWTTIQYSCNLLCY
ncbi:unnamed protein product, partial [Ectocarpus sp. 12 AP-2014]